MRAAVFYEHGLIDVLKYVDDLPVPEVGSGQVRLKMGAAALNRLDLWVRVGWNGLKLHLPHVTGSDGAGIVDAIGTGVTGFAPGDRVCIDPTIVPSDSPTLYTGLENQGRIGILGEHHSGLAAEYVVVPARNLLKLPNHVSFEGASAAGLVYVTAWHSLITRGNLRPGETVLIVGAGGGVNTASIQIAKLAGAKVYVVGSNAEKCRKAQELGADVTINREETPDWSKAIYQLTQKQGVDVVVDNVGQETMFNSIRSVRIGGRILVVGNTSGPIFELDIRYLFSKHISIIGSTMGPHVDYVRVMNLVFEGQLKPVISETLPLSEIQTAHRLLEAGEVFGKVVIRI
ncbi:MAG: zinc-binding dehydrogenase [Anaerolineae bacterium]|jgi:NADPH:quinone reductase-like Zn-dependent oxidoreductase|nr:zinc-binding dehydrogenase [Anaerolineae bacterium]